MRSIIAFQGKGGYLAIFNRRTRCSNFSPLKFSIMCYRLKHKFSKTFVEIDQCGAKSSSKLHNKVFALMDYNLPGNGQKKSEKNLKDALDDLDISLICKRFPSITLGNAPQVDLYDGTTPYSEMTSILATDDFGKYFSEPSATRWVQNPLSEALPSLYVNHSSVTSSTLRTEDSFPCPLSPDSMSSIYEEHLDNQVTREISQEKEGLQSSSNVQLNELFLDKPISFLPRLSKRLYQQLDNSGFHTLRKMLHHFPRSYANLQNAHAEIDDGQYLIFVGKVLSSRGVRASCSFSFLEVVVGCQVSDSESTSDHVTGNANERPEKTIYLHLKKFFRGARFTFTPFLKSLEKKYQEGDIACVSGKVRTMRSRDHYEMREYNIDVLEDGKDLSFCARERPYPIYPSKGGLKPLFLRDIIARALQALPVNVDPIPKDIIEQFGLLTLHDAYFGIHKPNNIKEADLARKRLIFDEFFYLQLGRLFQMLEGLGTQIEKDGLLDKYRRPKNNTLCTEEWSSLTKNFLETLPYTLTSSQQHAVSEIIWDLKRPVPMNRLLQGDVGCGKTIVAFLACMEVIGSGYQAAFMVPTELLAIQHHEHLLNLLENLGEVKFKPTVALLTGSTPLKQSRMIRKGIQTGEISMVIGTHSLIAEKVEFSALRIAVVDEQHRFGVIQRGRFNSKLYYSSSILSMEEAVTDSSSKSDAYMAPHVLAMSATPIPRTLALALYGDMSLTQITDLPPGRIPVKTYTIEGDDKGFENVYKMMLDELEDGGKVYLVYPIIELSEQLPQLRAAAADLEVISSQFQGYNCGLLHGKMKGDEKEETLRKFRAGELDILLATQVIEIGVDVPDASMMVVMNSERFGIAQLHQLRGRVGRGVKASKCILVASTSSSLSRLKILERSSDGFHLANVDLLLRGPGDLLGKKQSGHLPEFPVARLEADGNILQDAHTAALKVLSASHDLEQFPALKLELSMRQPLCLLGD
ncbi:PREDICTED: ATP-dependent DNA helicase homolog RECG, chloroplastic isoform X2 [Lupinus angustifolius]|nr:PREDICTED: ATP-dependent DNA helicase homolog RECG, chloroplastic isoform X2 [Lupinus angustifolius]